MRQFRRTATFALGCSLGILSQIGAAPAQDFQGKQIELSSARRSAAATTPMLGFSRGTWDGSFPGNPTIVVKNMPGAGGRIAANYLAIRAARDGTSFGILQNTLTLDQLAKTREHQFRHASVQLDRQHECAVDALRRVAARAAGDQRTMLEREFVVGASNVGSSLSIIPHILNNLVGTKFKIVQGYAGTNEVLLAMERKEMAGMCGWGWDSLRVQALGSGRTEGHQAGARYRHRSQSGAEGAGRSVRHGHASGRERQARAASAARGRKTTEGRLRRLPGVSAQNARGAAKGVPRDARGSRLPGGCREGQAPDSSIRRPSRSKAR